MLNYGVGPRCMGRHVREQWAHTQIRTDWFPGSSKKQLKTTDHDRDYPQRRFMIQSHDVPLETDS